MPSRPLLLPLLASAILHLSAFALADLLCRTQTGRPSSPPTRLDAELHITAPAPPVDSLLKDTLATSEKPKPAKPVRDDKPGTGHRAAEQAATKKLAKHIFYPPEAVAAGLEGEVRLLLTLDERGAVREVQVAASSGHAILDQAAMRAAYAMGSLPGLDRREIILPVTFRLQP